MTEKPKLQKTSEPITLTTSKRLLKMLQVKLLTVGFLPTVILVSYLLGLLSTVFLKGADGEFQLIPIGILILITWISLNVFFYLKCYSESHTWGELFTIEVISMLVSVVLALIFILLIGILGIIWRFNN
jgi:hypothetical protein